MPAVRRPKRPPAPRPPAPASPASAPLPAWAVGGLLATLHLLLCAVAFNPGPHTGGDNAIYVSLARALLDGRGYVELWDPAAPPHGQYPPVFPLMLAGGMLLGLKPWVGLKAMMVACSAASVALSYLWLRRAATPGLALGAGLVAAMAPGVVDLSYWVLSDVPFWLFTTLALWAASHADPREGPSGDAEARGAVTTHAGRWLALAGAAVLLAFFTRSAGLPLVVGFGAWLLVRRRLAAAAAFAVATAVPALLWSAYVRGTGAPSYRAAFLAVDPYRPELGSAGAGQVAMRGVENLGRYLSTHLPQLLVGDRAGWAVGVAGAFVLLAVAGWALRVRRLSLPTLLLPPYVGLLLVWPPTWSGERFLLPVLPVLLLFAGDAAVRLAARAGLPRWSPAAACALLLLATLPGTAALARNGIDCRAEAAAGKALPCRPATYDDLMSVARQAGPALPPGAPLYSRKPSLVYAFSGHPGRLYPLSTDPDEFFRVARAAGIEWFLVDRIPDLAPQYLTPVMVERRERVCMVREHQRPNAGLFRIIAPGFVARGDLQPGNFRFCDALPPEAFVLAR